MIKLPKLKSVFAFLACIFITSINLYAQTVYVSSWDGLNSALNSAETSITFTSGTIVYSSGLPTIGYTDPIGFYADVTLNGNNAYLLFSFSSASVNFNNNINFINGVFNSSGGAIYTSNSSNINFKSSSVNFMSNTATYGGGIYASNSSDINFISAMINFTSNTATTYGGAIVSSNSHITIENSTAVFYGNRATSYSGGAVYLNVGSIATFKDSNINFTNNTSYHGGAIFISSNSNINVENSTVAFAGNSARWYAGAIEANGSNINFTSSTVSFTGNAGPSYAGAISANASNINFTNSTVDFTGNTAREPASLTFGGAISASGSNINFTNSTVNFISNISSSGGAISGGSSNITFTSSTVNFTNNKAETYGNFTIYQANFSYGGAISGGNIIFNNSNVTFSGNATSTSNGTYSSGGAINGANVIFNDSNVIFSGNRVQASGGAVRFGGEFTINGSALFDGNSVTLGNGKGGAIYMNGGGLLNLGAIATSSITFRNNSAAVGRDIYLDPISNSTMNINGLGDVIFGGGIEGSGTINKTNTGKVYFEAGSKTDFKGIFNIDEGRVYFSTSVYINELNIFGGGIGVEADFSSALGSSTSFIYTTTTTLASGAKLYVKKFGTAVAGSSTAVVFAQYRSGTFDIGSFGYRFAWAADNLLSSYTYTGWLLYSPWNYFAEEYQKTGRASGEILYVEENIKAAAVDENPFGATLSDNFTIAGYEGDVYEIDADNRTDKGFILNGKTLKFQDLTFQNFISTGNGAVIEASNSNITFENEINFRNNSASFGGAVHTQNSSINFTSSIVNFTSNAATDGGAVYVSNSSNINFESSTVNFTSNTAGNGGAIYIGVDSSVDFGDSGIKATGNVAASSGGFIYSQGKNVNIDVDNVKLERNTAEVGGTFYGQSGAVFTFTAGNSEIKNNEAGHAGGYMALGVGGTADFSQTNVLADSNTAGEYGGFMYLEGTQAKALFGEAEFRNNTASYGGAIALLGSGSIEFTGDEAVFRDNRAETAGGAIYAQGANDRVIFSVLNGNMIFENNIANGTKNDIYLGENINFELRIDSNSIVSIGSGMKGVESSTFTKTGFGKIELLNDSINEHYGEFKIEQGTVEVKETAGAVFGKLNIGVDGIYSLINNNTYQETRVGEADISGKMEIDVDVNNERADMLKAELNITPTASGDVYLRSGSKLKLNMYGIKLGESEITIIEAQGKVKGSFSNDPFEELGYVREAGEKNPAVLQTENRVYIKMIQGSNFENGLKKLTHNQMAVARSADKITSGKAPVTTIREEFFNTVKKLDVLGSDEEKKKALDELAGAGLANILSMGAYGYGHEEIFERLQPRINDETNKVSKNIWAQTYTYGRDNEGDKNSIGKFEISGYGLEAGADIIGSENKIAGVYGSYEKSAAKQGKSKGEIESLGIGAYGGWFGENTDIKARVYGGKLQYKIDRVLELLKEEAQGETEGYNVKMDLFGQYNIWVNDTISISPYGHIKGGYVKNSAMKDKGRGGANIEVYDDSYMRVETRLGIGINYAIKRLAVYGKISGGYLAAGERAEYKGEFIDTGEEMDIWGAKGGKVSLGAGIGAEYEITDRWSVYANISGNYFESGKEYYGNAGVNYSFRIGKIRKIEELENKVIERVISEKDIIRAIEVKGKKNGVIVIDEETMEKIGLEKGKKFYVIKYGRKVLLFKNKEDLEQFKERVREEGGRVKREAVEMVLEGNEISLKGYEKELGDTRDGMLIMQYENGINEIRPIPEEAKKIQRNAIIENALGESKASMVWEMEVEGGVVKISKEVVDKLEIKEGSSIYLLSYGKRVFLFKGREEAERFVEKLNETGANIDEEDIREIKGLEVREEGMELEEKEIEEIGDLRRGVRLEHYEKVKTTEIKSIEEEEKREKEEEITQEKVEESKERREKPMIKKYRLNVANFALNEYLLTKEAKEIIEREANEIRKYDYRQITVEGHTDSLGGDKINEKISRQRAESVYKEFLLNGIPVEKIGYVGYGSKVPVSPNNTKEGRATNRRTEIYVE